MSKKEEMAVLFNNLTSDSQSHLLTLANVAKIAENAKQKEHDQQTKESA